MDLVVRDVVPADADAIVGTLNPIIAARIYTAFDAPFTSEAERDYPRGYSNTSVFIAPAWTRNVSLAVLWLLT